MATQFLNGVSKEIRIELRRLPTAPKTLKEMVTRAEKIDCPRPRRLAQRRGEPAPPHQRAGEDWYSSDAILLEEPSKGKV